ncbi:MAG: diacylglycerol/lipid kinase family protein [Elusimicrobiales bacterium]
MNRFVFIINPKSGLKINTLVERIILKKASCRNVECCLDYTKEKGDAGYLALKYFSEGFNRIICVGGDGTIREIAEVMAGRSGVAIGIVPCGSGNGAARNLSIPLDIEKAIDLVFDGKIKEIDAGICNCRLFINVCGFGFDAHIAKVFNRNRVRGLLPYFIHGFFSFFKYKPIKTLVEFDGRREFFMPFVAAVANGRQYGGGAIISPSSLMDDGLLEFVSVDMASFHYYIKRIHTLFNGDILKNSFVKHYSSCSFKIQLPQKSVYHLDGEDFISEDGILRISVMRKAIKFIVKDEIF